MRQEIFNTQNHPKKNALKEYLFEAPEGEWQGRLDYLAWGKSSNLLCYFTETTTGAHYRFSVFSRNDYKPYNSHVAFDEEQSGGTFKITTSLSKNGLPKFTHAHRVSAEG